MTGRGDCQKQLAALWATAKSYDLTFEDIVPEHMKEEISQWKEIAESRELIKDLQEREEQLKAANEALNSDLVEKQLQIDNAPAEHQSTIIDLQQAQRQVANNKDTIDDLTERVGRYRAQAKGIVAIKQADAAATEKLENLQMEIQGQQILIGKLTEDNRKFIAMSEQLHEADAKALKRKEFLLARKEKELVEKEDLITKLRQQAHNMHSIGIVSSADDDDYTTTLSEQLQDDLVMTREENIDLLQRNLELSEHNRALVEQYKQTKTQLYEVLASHESLDPNFAAIVSETKTLSRFHQASSRALDSFVAFFSASKSNRSSLTHIGVQLNAAQEALGGYFEVKNIVRTTDNQLDNENPDQVALYKELDSLAEWASDSVISLETLYSGLWSFLNQLSHDPKMLSDLNGALCDYGSVQNVGLDSCD